MHTEPDSLSQVFLHSAEIVLQSNLKLKRDRKAKLVYAQISARVQKEAASVPFRVSIVGTYKLRKQL